MKSIRSTTRRLMLAGSLALILPLTASAACPPDDAPDQGPPGGHHGTRGPSPMAGEPGRFGEDLLPQQLRGLDLSQAQLDRIVAVMQAQMPALRARSREARDAAAQLHELALSPEYDEVMSSWLADVQAKALSELALLRARADHEIHQVLTPEQRKRFAESRRRFGARGRSEGRDVPLPPEG